MALCRTCPVLGSCLAWALQSGDLHGVWGGTTARERRAMAVVWHSGRPSPLPEPAIPASPAPSAPVGPAMDRAELLRLVQAG
jgi:hypothetical protein